MGSDGMTIDDEGNVYVVGRGVTVFNSRGEKIDSIAVNKPWTANITFGGPDRSTAVYHRKRFFVLDQDTSAWRALIFHSSSRRTALAVGEDAAHHVCFLHSC